MNPLDEVVDQMWDEFDEDKNGLLDINEIRKMFEVMGIDKNNDQLIDNFYKEVDKDGNQLVSKEEFCDYINDLRKQGGFSLD